MHKLFILFLVPLLFVGCSAHYKYLEPANTSIKLDNTKAVLISIPENGWYMHKEYKNSGRIIAQEISRQVSKWTSGQVSTTQCKDYSCLSDQDKNDYQYYIKTNIMNYEDRATAWSMRPDRLHAKVTVVDIKTGEILASTTFYGKSKIISFGRDYPSQLLRKPLHIFLTSLYE